MLRISSSLFVAFSLILLPGCDQATAMFNKAKAATADATAEEAPPAEADPSAEATQAPQAASPASAEQPAAQAAPTADQPCIVGHWEAIEYTAAVRRAINKDPELRSMKKTSSGGHITYVVDPPTDGRGTVTATADNLRYGFSGKIHGMGVNLNVKINGDTEATYTLEGDSKIVVDRPSRNDMKVKAKVKVKGLGSTRRGDTVDLDFDGSFIYTCTDDTLEVWYGERTGRPMKFRRGEG